MQTSVHKRPGLYRAAGLPVLLRERINYLPNERKNDLLQQVTKHDGRKT